MENPLEVAAKNSKSSNPIFEFRGRRYYKCGEYWQEPSDGSRLHRDVWEEKHGPIPSGFHIHHVDGNKANSKVENLELLLASDHLSGHMQGSDRIEKSTQSLLAHAVPAAVEWRKKHPEAARAITAKAVAASTIAIAADVAEYDCVQCGKHFTGKAAQRKGAQKAKQHGPFCCYNCSMAHRRARGADDIEFTCPVCGKSFRSNRYKPSRTCSRSCGHKLRIGRRL